MMLFSVILIIYGLIFGITASKGNLSCQENGDCRNLSLYHVPYYVSKNIQIFNLQMNNLKVIYRNVSFENFDLLETLDLSYNYIDYIQEDSFVNLPKLKNLIIMFNQLTSFNQRLPNVEILSLAYNHLTSFYAQDNKIKYLNLNNTDLTAIPLITQSHTLLDLNLAFTKIQKYSAFDIIRFCKLKNFTITNVDTEREPHADCSCREFNYILDFPDNHPVNNITCREDRHLKCVADTKEILSLFANCTNHKAVR